MVRLFLPAVKAAVDDGVHYGNIVTIPAYCVGDISHHISQSTYNMCKDDVIFEEFKGTGNMELHLDRKLQERRIFPAIDLNKSSTRREELLLTPYELDAVWSMRKLLNADTGDATETLIKMLVKTSTNEEFIKQLNLQMHTMQKEGYTIIGKK